MRVTNKMILTNSAHNINEVKVGVDKANTQMTNQQKINRPSEDPVIAVRSLRLQTTYSKTEQYYRKNIPDAESWLEVTETALKKMKDVITDMRTLAINGATGTLTQEDRNTIRTQLKALQEEIYTLGNADYAGRTVFTGYRTDRQLTFMGNEKDTAYTIKQKISSEKILPSRYYSNMVDIPSSPAEVNALTPAMSADMTTRETNYYRMRLAYNDINGDVDNGVPAIDPANLSIKYANLDPVTHEPILDAFGNPTYTDITPPAGNISIYQSEAEWEAVSGIKEVAPGNIVIIKGTGDVIYGDDLAYSIQSNKAELDITYTKKGFTTAELRPEYYFNCTDITDPLKHIDYVKENRAYDINYSIAENQALKVNVEAPDVFNHSIYQDMADMINAVTYSIDAHDKMTKIEDMLKDPNYADKESQGKLMEWRALCQKEVDYADDNLDKLYTEEIKYTDQYLADMNLSITRLGCTVDTLKMTKSRMSDYEENVMKLQSENDNVDLSQVIIDYTAIYNAYQSSLTAAGKLYQQTLLNYI